jgi:hypothetical protein
MILIMSLVSYPMNFWTDYFMLLKIVLYLPNFSKQLSLLFLFGFTILVLDELNYNLSDNVINQCVMQLSLSPANFFLLPSFSIH